MDYERGDIIRKRMREEREIRREIFLATRAMENETDEIPMAPTPKKKPKTVLNVEGANKPATPNPPAASATAEPSSPVSQNSPPTPSMAEPSSPVTPNPQDASATAEPSNPVTQNSPPTPSMAEPSSPVTPNPPDASATAEPSNPATQNFPATTAMAEPNNSDTPNPPAASAMAEPSNPATQNSPPASFMVEPISPATPNPPSSSSTTEPSSPAIPNPPPPSPADHTKDVYLQGPSLTSSPLTSDPFWGCQSPPGFFQALNTFSPLTELTAADIDVNTAGYMREMFTPEKPCLSKGEGTPTPPNDYMEILRQNGELDYFSSKVVPKRKIQYGKGDTITPGEKKKQKLS